VLPLAVLVLRVLLELESKKKPIVLPLAVLLVRVLPVFE